MTKHSPHPRPDKVHGWRHIVAATRYSMAGFRRLLDESAFRHETMAFGVIVILFFAVGAKLSDHVIAFILFLLIAAFEAINTAIEELVDRISPELSAMARHAKDLGSFSVFCLVIANGAWAAYVLSGALFGW